jgi:peroxiredoxin
MRSVFLPWIVASAIASAGVLCWLGSQGLTESGGPARSEGLPAEHVTQPERHYVTPRQLLDSGSVARRSVVPLRATANDGREVDWEQLSGGQPVVVVFIKDGCPCSVEFEPFFLRVEKAYHGQARFVGVIDAPVEVARRYAEANRVPYPILADPQHTLIRRFQAANAAYVALVSPEGIVETLWPGCSAEMLRDLSARIAALAKVEEPALDVTGMPGPLTTGCPFAE